MQKIRINGKTYSDANQNGWLPSLALFTYVCKVQKNRRIYFKKNQRIQSIKKLSSKIGVGFTTLNKHINILKKKGLVTYESNYIVFKKTSEMVRIMDKVVFIPETVNTYSDCKLFLNSIPFISKLYQQKRTISSKQHLLFIKHRVDRNQRLSPADYKQYKKCMSKIKCNTNYQVLNKKIYATINKVLNLIDRKSCASAVKYKQFLQRVGVFKCVNSLSKVIDNVSHQDYTYLRSNDMIGVKYTKFKNNCIWKLNPTEYILA